MKLGDRESIPPTMDTTEGYRVGLVHHLFSSHLVGRNKNRVHEEDRATDSGDARGSVGTPLIEEDRMREWSGEEKSVMKLPSTAEYSGESAPIPPDCDRPFSSSTTEKEIVRGHLVSQTQERRR